MLASLRQKDNVPALLAGKKFGRFKKEEEVGGKDAEVKEEKNENIASLKFAWERLHLLRADSFDNGYDTALEAVSWATYSAEDVSRFCIMLSEFTQERNFSNKAGVFLSALVNRGPEKAYTLHVSHLGTVNHLGYANAKDLTIVGDAGDYLGSSMIEGEIILKGSARNYAGNEMKGGCIRIEEDAGRKTGYLMQGGLLVVEGNAEENLGHGMNGGTLHLKG